MINNTNVFAALDTLKKKKKKNNSDHKSQPQSSKGSESESDPQVFWTLSPLNSKSWADVDDDDDYYATTAPPQPPPTHHDHHKPNILEDSESEEDMLLDEGDDDDVEEEEHPEYSVKAEPEVKKHSEVHVEPKEVEHQLSKKERKKKELAELDALLADFGVTQKESNGKDVSQGASQDKKAIDVDGDGEKKDNITAESKNAKKKKKKDKASKDVRQSHERLNRIDTNNEPDDATGADNVDEGTSTVDVKERLKKIASVKKKKSSKEMDAAAKVAHKRLLQGERGSLQRRKRKKTIITSNRCSKRILWGANDLITIFVAPECFSLCSYLRTVVENMSEGLCFSCSYEDAE